MSRGQIIEKSKGVWLVRIESKSGNKRKSFSKQIRGTKKDAEKFLTAWLRDIDKGIFIEPSKQSLNEHLDEWLTMIKPRVAEQTFKSYESMLRIHIRPKIGDVELSGLKIPTVQKVYSAMNESGLSPRTVRYAHSVLSMALSKAVELGYTVNNPCNYAELPREVKNETKAFSPEQAQKFLAKAQDDKHGIIFEFALSTGMRPEEFLSLKWSDIDLEKGAATVQRALVWLKGGFKFAETKTAKSRRTVPFPKSLLPKLKEHKRRQAEHRLKLGQAYQNYDLVFASESGKPHHYRNLTQRHFEKILKQAGLDKGGFVLYSLRHSCATLLLSAGENPKVVSERLGHSGVKMTLDVYSHVLPTMQEAATNKLEALLYQESKILA